MSSACIRCGSPHRGAADVCEDCDGLSGDQLLEELRAESRELQLWIAAAGPELTHTKKLCVLIADVAQALAMSGAPRRARQEAINRSANALRSYEPEWQEHVSDMRRELKERKESGAP